MPARNPRGPFLLQKPFRKADELGLAARPVPVVTPASHDGSQTVHALVAVRVIHEQTAVDREEKQMRGFFDCKGKGNLPVRR